MSKINTVINFGTAQLRQICEELKGKPFPNWWQIEDMQGFGIHITEGDLNLRLMTVIYPVDEAGPGNFLVKIQTAFMGKDVPAESGGYHFVATPIGAGIELDAPIVAGDQQELQDGILQWISEEAENILCQMLQ
ncbi:hypothetical protein F9Z84_07175 [Escherichia coli]|nr:hypothetical protein F9Z84_07175 [Escherichia coli]